jgi:hypothetical protein
MTSFYLSYFDKSVDFRCAYWSDIVKVFTNIGDAVRTDSSSPNKIWKFTCVSHVCQVYTVQLVAHAYLILRVRYVRTSAKNVASHDCNDAPFLPFLSVMSCFYTLTTVFWTWHFTRRNGIYSSCGYVWQRTLALVREVDDLPDHERCTCW